MQRKKMCDKVGDSGVRFGRPSAYNDKEQLKVLISRGWEKEKRTTRALLEEGRLE